MVDKSEKFKSSYIKQKLSTSDKWVINSVPALIKHNKVLPEDKDVMGSLNQFLIDMGHFKDTHIKIARRILIGRYINILTSIANGDK